MKTTIVLVIFLISSFVYAGGCSDSDPNFIIRPSSHPSGCVTMELENIDATGSHTWAFSPIPIDASTGLPLSPHPYSLAAGATKIVYWTSAGDKDIRYDGGSWETFHNCNCNPIAADYFEDAPLICNSDFYCGTTSSAYGVDQTGPLECNGGADHEGSLENNSWLKFIADGSTANFDIDVLGGCYIQFAVYAYNPGAANANDMFVLMTDIDWTDIDVGFTGSNTIVATGLTPGNEYYLHFDGHGGAECDYEIGFNSGFATTGLAASSNLVCPGDAVTLTATPNDPSASYLWTVNGGAPFSGGSTLNVNPAVTTTYSVAIILTGCDQTPEQVVVDMDVCAPLPVELSSFTIDCGTNNRLNWITASEHQSDYFEVLVGNSPESMETVSVIDAAGFSNEVREYHYFDPNPSRELLYYQLKQVDLNGDQKFSEIISSSNCTDEEILSLYNRGQNKIEVHYNTTVSSKTEVVLSDISGREIYRGTFDVPVGHTVVNLEVEGGNELLILNTTLNETTYSNKHFIH